MLAVPRLPGIGRVERKAPSFKLAPKKLLMKKASDHLVATMTTRIDRGFMIAVHAEGQQDGLSASQQTQKTPQMDIVVMQQLTSLQQQVLDMSKLMLQQQAQNQQLLQQVANLTVQLATTQQMQLSQQQAAQSQAPAATPAVDAPLAPAAVAPAPAGAAAVPPAPAPAAAAAQPSPTPPTPPVLAAPVAPEAVPAAAAGPAPTLATARAAPQATPVQHAAPTAPSSQPAPPPPPLPAASAREGKSIRQPRPLTTITPKQVSVPAATALAATAVAPADVPAASTPAPAPVAPSVRTAPVPAPAAAPEVNRPTSPNRLQRPQGAAQQTGPVPTVTIPAFSEAQRGRGRQGPGQQRQRQQGAGTTAPGAAAAAAAGAAAEEPTGPTAASLAQLLRDHEVAGMQATVAEVDQLLVAARPSFPTASVFDLLNILVWLGAAGHRPQPSVLGELVGYLLRGKEKLRASNVTAALKALANLAPEVTDRLSLRVLDPLHNLTYNDVLNQLLHHMGASLAKTWQGVQVSSKGPEGTYPAESSTASAVIDGQRGSAASGPAASGAADWKRGGSRSAATPEDSARADITRVQNALTPVLQLAHQQSKLKVDEGNVLALITAFPVEAFDHAHREALVSILYSCIKLGVTSIPSELLKHMTGKIVSRMHTLPPNALALFAASMAQLQAHTPDSDSNLSIIKLPDSITISAAGYGPGPNWAQRLAQCSEEALPCATLSEQAAYVQALVAMGITPGVTWVRELVKHSSPLLRGEPPKQQAAGISASSSGPSAGESHSQYWCNNLADTLPTSQLPAAIAAICSGLGLCRAHQQGRPVPGTWVQLLAGVVEARATAFSAAELTDALWGLLQMGCTPSDQALNSLVIKMLGRAAGLPATTLMRAAAVAGACRTGNQKWWEELQGLLTPILTDPSHSVRRKDLAALLHGCADMVTPAKAGAKPGAIKPAFGAALMAAAGASDVWKDSDVVQVVESIAVLGLGLPVQHELLAHYEALLTGNPANTGELAAAAKRASKSEAGAWQQVVRAKRYAAVAWLQTRSGHSPSQAWVKLMLEAVQVPSAAQLSDITAARCLWAVYAFRQQADGLALSSEWLQVVATKATSPALVKGASLQQILETLEAVLHWQGQIRVSLDSLQAELPRKLQASLSTLSPQDTLQVLQVVGSLRLPLPTQLRKDLIAHITKRLAVYDAPTLLRTVNSAVLVCGRELVPAQVVQQMDERMLPYLQGLAARSSGSEAPATRAISPAAVQENVLEAVVPAVHTLLAQESYTPPTEHMQAYLDLTSGHLHQASHMHADLLLGAAAKFGLQPTSAWFQELCQDFLEPQVSSLSLTMCASMVIALGQMQTQWRLRAVPPPDTFQLIVTLLTQALRRHLLPDAPAGGATADAQPSVAAAIDGDPQLSAADLSALLVALSSLGFVTGPLLTAAVKQLAAAVQREASELIARAQGVVQQPGTSTPFSLLSLTDRGTLMDMAAALTRALEYEKQQAPNASDEDTSLSELVQAAQAVGNALDTWAQLRLPVLKAMQVMELCVVFTVIEHPPSASLQRSLWSVLQQAVPSMSANEAYTVCKFCEMCFQTSQTGTWPAGCKTLMESLLNHFVGRQNVQMQGEVISVPRFHQLSTDQLLEVLQLATDMGYRPSENWREALQVVLLDKVHDPEINAEEQPSEAEWEAHFGVVLALLRTARPLLEPCPAWVGSMLQASLVSLMTRDPAAAAMVTATRESVEKQNLEEVAAARAALAARQDSARGKKRRGGKGGEAVAAASAATSTGVAPAEVAATEIRASEAVADVDVEVEVEGGSRATAAAVMNDRDLHIPPRIAAQLFAAAASYCPKVSHDLLRILCSAALPSLQRTALILRKEDEALEGEEVWDLDSAAQLLLTIHGAGYNPGSVFFGEVAAAVQPQLVPEQVLIPPAAIILSAFAAAKFDPGQTWLAQLVDSIQPHMLFISQQEAQHQQMLASMTGAASRTTTGDRTAEAIAAAREQATLSLTSLLSALASFKHAPSQAFMYPFYTTITYMLQSLSARRLAEVCLCIQSLSPLLVSTREGAVGSEGGSRLVSALPAPEVLDALMMAVLVRAGAAGQAGSVRVAPVGDRSTLNAGTDDLTELKKAREALQLLLSRLRPNEVQTSQLAA